MMPRFESQPTTPSELRSVLLRWTVLLVAAGAFALWAGWRLADAASHAPTAQPSAAAGAAEPKIDYWTCTMHPQVQQPEPGKCPICGMELVPKYAGRDEPGDKPAAAPPETAAPTTQDAWYRCTMPECGDVGSDDPNSRCPVCGMKRERMETGGGGAEGEFEITLGERARRLAEVETEIALPRMLFKRIRTVGRVSYDETRYKMVSAWIGGRIDKLFADFTGMSVAKGDHLVEIYSPELLSAQEEYLQALRAADSTGQTGIAQRSGQQLLTAARRKLELLGVTDVQLAQIEREGQPQTHLVVYAPIGGTVVAKQAMEGMYVKTGDPLYTIADLRHLWVLVDLYESDLPWVRTFQPVRITTRSLPGDVFTGEIFFVDPSVDPATRTVEVRIHVENPELRLKPDMWVTAEIDAALAQGARGTVPLPSGAFACPMHPWETADVPGACPICGMELVPIDTLPEFGAPRAAAPLLSVSRGAVMQTGERALVYVESAPGTYRGVEVVVGPLAQDAEGREYYPILAGLQGGEHVVTRGNFAIDSQMQLAGKPSLFTARGMPVDDAVRRDELDRPMQLAHPTTGPADVAQTICPVMGNEIDPQVFVDYRGVRVYFCCPPCIQKFEANPEKYIPNLPASMQAKLSAAGGGAGHD